MSIQIQKEKRTIKDFISVITENDIKLLVSKYIYGTLSDTEAVLLVEWIKSSPQHATDFRREVEVLTAKGSTTVNAVKYWHRFSSHNRLKPVNQGWFHRYRVSVGVSIAAMVVVIIVAATSYVGGDRNTVVHNPHINTLSFNKISNKQEVVTEDITYSAPKTERRSVKLSDGSTVILNAGATLTLNSEFNVTGRSVALDGEAYFNIAKNPEKLFSVHCGDKTYIVRGTSFNIISYDTDRYSVVTLHTGSLEAYIKKDVIVLKPGEELRIDSDLNQITKQEVDVNNSISWIKNRQLKFADYPLKFVANQLGHKYHVKINIHNSIENILYDGQIDDESLEDALHLVSITAPVPLSVTEFDGEYYVSKRSL